MKFRIALLSALAMAAVTSTAQATDAGDWILRVGVHSVRPESDNHDLVNVDAAEMLTFNGTYMLAPNWGVEVLAALPFQHDINLNGGGKVGETKHLPPTVSAQYHFLPDGKVRPYVGAGLNYTMFFKEKTQGALAGADLKLEDSFGLAAQFGIDIDLTHDWYMNADARWMDIDTKAKVNGASIGKVHLDPLAFGVSVGRRF